MIWICNTILTFVFVKLKTVIAVIQKKFIMLKCKQTNSMMQAGYILDLLALCLGVTHGNAMFTYMYLMLWQFSSAFLSWPLWLSNYFYLGNKSEYSLMKWFYGAIKKLYNKCTWRSKFEENNLNFVKGCFRNVMLRCCYKIILSIQQLIYSFFIF